MVALVRTNPFVTTLSTLLIYRGAAFIILGGQPLAGIRVFQAIDSGFALGSTYRADSRRLVLDAHRFFLARRCGRRSSVSTSTRSGAMPRRPDFQESRPAGSGSRRSS